MLKAFDAAGLTAEIVEKQFSDRGLYMAKATAYLQLNEPDLMDRALKDACQFGYQPACK